MDHTLNTSNLPETFAGDLQSTEQTYFTSEREQILYSSDSDSDEDELVAEEPDTNIELDPEMQWRECDVKEHQKVESFLAKGCGCSLNVSTNGYCSNNFSLENVLEHRQICLEMATSELDMVILAQFEACTKRDELSLSSRQTRQRTRTRTNFTFQGRVKTMLRM